MNDMICLLKLENHRAHFMIVYEPKFILNPNRGNFIDIGSFSHLNQLAHLIRS